MLGKLDISKFGTAVLAAIVADKNEDFIGYIMPGNAQEISKMKKYVIQYFSGVK